jgi:hypothetical protein
MPRYLSPRKAAKYKDLIEKLARIISHNKYETFVVESATPNSLYDDLWTIRSHLFSPHSYRFKFKKQFNGVWVEVLPPFNSADVASTIDLFDGETVETSLARGAIGSKILLDKPEKIRFYKDLLSPTDVEKLTTLGNLNNYSVETDEKYIIFTKQTN